jgi:hypothetical protein
MEDRQRTIFRARIGETGMMARAGAACITSLWERWDYG